MPGQVAGKFVIVTHNFSHFPPFFHAFSLEVKKICGHTQFLPFLSEIFSLWLVQNIFAAALQNFHLNFVHSPHDNTSLLALLLESLQSVAIAIGAHAGFSFFPCACGHGASVLAFM